MTAPPRDESDHLAVLVPPQTVSDEPDSDVWAAGRRRRIRRRLLGVLGLAIALTVVALSVMPLSSGRTALFPAWDSNGSAITAYPERIGRQWWVRDLPDRPGPVSAIVEMATGDAHMPAAWFAVSESGYRWRVPSRPVGDDNYPTLSPNGRFLGYLDGDSGPYVIRDLVSGKRITFPEIGSGIVGSTTHTQYATFGQWPSFWSSDSRRLVIGGSSRGDYTGRALLLNIDGRVSALPNKSDYPAGWIGSDALLWFGLGTGVPDPSSAAAAPIVARVTDVAGQPIRAVTLHPSPSSPPWQGRAQDQWSAVASPDGTEIAIIEAEFGYTILHRFSLADGAEHPTAVPVSGYRLPCAVSWVGSDLTVPVVPESRAEGTTIVVRNGQPLPVLAVEPGLGTMCFIWAADALRGEGRGWPFGHSNRWWTWWWQEIGLAAVLIAALRLFWRRRRSRASRSGVVTGAQ